MSRDVILSIFGGLLIDRAVRVRTRFITVMVLSLLGEAIFTIGTYMKSFSMTIVAGWFVLAGCELGSLKSAISVFETLWFKDKELIFAMSLNFCSTRVGAELRLVLPQITLVSRARL